MKVLAKIGLIAAAAAAVLFIFLYETDNSWSGERSMASAPEESISDPIPEASIASETEDPDNEVDEILPAVSSTEEAEQPQEEPVTEEVVAEEVEEAPVEEEVENINMRRIYGKITLSDTGENLAGVNIMVPGSNVAKVSNNIGGYTIQVPIGTRELVFIYRGKKLVQPLRGSDNLLNVRLNLETMQYD